MFIKGDVLKDTCKNKNYLIDKDTDGHYLLHSDIEEVLTYEELVNLITQNNFQIVELKHQDKFIIKWIPQHFFK